MARPKNLECLRCEAVFKVNHDMDDRYYEPEFCVFCGSTLELEEELEIFDDYEDEE